MNPIITRVILVLAGVVTAASQVDKFDTKTLLMLFGMFLAGIGALNAPGTPQLPAKADK